MKSVPAADDAARRQEVLAHYRARRGALRRTRADAESATAFMAERLEPFLRRRDVDPDAPEARLPAAEVRTLIEEAGTKRRATRAEKLGEPADAASEGIGADWKSLIEQASSGSFSETFVRWLGGVSPELGVTTTSIEDLERLHAETAFRARLLDALQQFTQHELEEIESQLETKKALAHVRA